MVYVTFTYSLLILIDSVVFDRSISALPNGTADIELHHRNLLSALKQKENESKTYYYESLDIHLATSAYSD